MRGGRHALGEVVCRDDVLRCLDSRCVKLAGLHDLLNGMARLGRVEDDAGAKLSMSDGRKKCTGYDCEDKKVLHGEPPRSDILVDGGVQI